MVKSRLILALATILILGTGYAVIETHFFRGNAAGSAAPAPSVSPSGSEKVTGLDTRSIEERVKRYCTNAYDVTCEFPTRTTKDPTGRVDLEISGEVRALRVLRKILSEHADWTSKQVEDELVERIYTDKRVKRIEAAYVWVKAQLQAIIERQEAGVFTPDEKMALLARINRVELDLPPPASKYADAADVFTKNTIYYERTPTNILRLRVGGAYLMNISSWFNLVFTLAHEFAHSIDPCELSVGAKPPEAYPDLISCFVQVGWVEPARSTCVENEQISEVFADWMAAEVLSSALLNTEKEYTQLQRIQAAVNSVRDLCEEAIPLDVLSMQNHQSPRVRIQKMFGENPKVRKSIGCGPQPNLNYCAFRSRSSL